MADILQFAQKTAATLQSLTLPENISSAHLNKLQCQHLSLAVFEAVKDAQEETHSLSSSTLQFCEPVLMELCRVAVDCERLVRDCCRDNWLLAAIILGDAKDEFAMRLFQIRWCVTTLRTIVYQVLRGGSELEAWLEQFELPATYDEVVEKECNTMGDIHLEIDQLADWDCRTTMLKLELITESKFTKQQCDLAFHILQRLLDRFLRVGNGGSCGWDRLWKVNPTDYQVVQAFGSAAHGELVQITWHGEKHSMVRHDTESVSTELNSWAGLCHSSIVRLLGYFVDGRSCALMTEYMSEDLQSFISRRAEIVGDAPLPIAVALDIMLQVAEGIQYLHSKGLVHGNLTPMHILVHPIESPELAEGAYLRAKLTGFQASRSTISNRPPHATTTISYMAPELFRDDGDDNTFEIPRVHSTSSAKVDVYSFAILSYELLSGKAAFASEPSDRVKQFVKFGVRPALPRTFPRPLNSLLRKCWENDARQRPNFQHICKELRHFKLFLMIGGEMQVQSLERLVMRPELEVQTLRDVTWIDYQELTIKRHLGQGSYGVVAEAEWLGKKVAVKSIQGLPNREHLLAEAELLSIVQHPNVVQLKACSFKKDKEGKGTGMLVMELMSQDLRSLIDAQCAKRKGHAPFTLRVALDILLQIAEAMRQLRACRVMHRDLRAANVLVNPRAGAAPEHETYYDVKLADFGMSKLKQQSSMFSSKQVGATPWRAPEAFKEDVASRKYTWSADVYSFGMTCYEILTGKLPFEDVQRADIYKLICEDVRPDLPLHCPIRLEALVAACWATDPSDRPDFTDICQRLLDCKADPDVDQLEGGDDPYNLSSNDMVMIRSGGNWQNPLGISLE